MVEKLLHADILGGGGSIFDQLVAAGWLWPGATGQSIASSTHETAKDDVRSTIGTESTCSKRIN